MPKLLFSHSYVWLSAAAVILRLPVCFNISMLIVVKELLLIEEITLNSHGRVSIFKSCVESKYTTFRSYSS